MKNITKQYQRWLCKFNTDFCGVGNMLVRYKYQMNSKCSSCGKEKKHTDHAILCQEQGASLIWTNKMKKLEDWMTSQDFHPKIVQVIVTGLHSWRTNTPNTYLPLNIHLQQAQTHQAQIGWFRFIEGFWTKEFQQCQQTFLTNSNIDKSSTLLLSKAQRRIQMVAWSLWEQRNSLLHKTNDSFHPKEINEINLEIEYETNKGLDNLNFTFSSLFSDITHTLLEKTHINKLNWLTTIWTICKLDHPSYFLDNFPPWVHSLNTDT